MNYKSSWQLTFLLHIASDTCIFQEHWKGLSFILQSDRKTHHMLSHFISHPNPNNYSYAYIYTHTHTVFLLHVQSGHMRKCISIKFHTFVVKIVPNGVFVITVVMSYGRLGNLLENTESVARPMNHSSHLTYSMSEFQIHLMLHQLTNRQ